MMKQLQQFITAGIFVWAVFVCGSAQAQQDAIRTTMKSPNETSKIALYKAKPVWKDMLDDPTANYFEVQKAFELFWEKREMPMEEDEIIGERDKLKDNLINRIFNANQLREQEECEALAFDCKRYRRWLIKTEPYIRDDGSIMSAEERLELWKKHYEELNEQGSK